MEGVLSQYERTVKPAFDKFVLPVCGNYTIYFNFSFWSLISKNLKTKKYADVIIPRGSENKVAIDLIVRHISQKLDDASKAK